jgi:uncharacterized protein (DUF2267 family)
MARVDAHRLRRRVEELARLPDPAPAEEAASVVLEELGACLTWGEAQNLADCLPQPMAARVRSATNLVEGTARFSGPAFVARVAERQGLDRAEAERRVGAVLTALREQLPAVRFGHLTEELTWSSGLVRTPDGRQ